LIPSQKLHIRRAFLGKWKVEAELSGREMVMSEVA
jgi:hypothetical protein